VLVAACAVVGLAITASTGSAAPRASVKVALVTDIGGLNDKGFNHLAYLGLQRAEKLAGVSGRVYITQTSQDRIGNLEAAAKDGYGMVVATGFNFFSDIPQVAPAFKSSPPASTSSATSRRWRLRSSRRSSSASTSARPR
jgi:basic membrane protein A